MRVEMSWPAGMNGDDERPHLPPTTPPLWLLHCLIREMTLKFLILPNHHLVHADSIDPRVPLGRRLRGTTRHIKDVSCTLQVVGIEQCPGKSAVKGLGMCRVHNRSEERRVGK